MFSCKGTDIDEEECSSSSYTCYTFFLNSLNLFSYLLRYQSNDDHVRISMTVGYDGIDSVFSSVIVMMIKCL